MKTPLIIDTDPGTDDALALLMALNASDVEVLGITTVGGNASCAQTTRNALKILGYVGRNDIPVATGAGRPFRGRFQYAYDFHGRGGLGIHLPLAHSRPVAEDAVSFMARLLRTWHDQVTVVALGPLTNVARLLQYHSGEARSIRRVVVMGGVLAGPGNTTPYAEFNIYNDPVAAEIVLSSGLPIVLVPLDACRQTVITMEEAAALCADSAAGRLALRILHRWFARHGPGRPYDLCDPLAMALAIDDTVASWQRGTVSVETQNRESIGRTLFSGGAGTISVAKKVDVARFRALMLRLLTIDAG